MLIKVIMEITHLRWKINLKLIWAKNKFEDDHQVSRQQELLEMELSDPLEKHKPSKKRMTSQSLNKVS
jgi:hypothetical protein